MRGRRTSRGPGVSSSPLPAVTRGRSRSDVLAPPKYSRSNSRETHIPDVDDAFDGLDISELARDLSSAGVQEGSDEDADEDEENVESVAIPEGSERITIVCACEEFNQVLLPELLTDRLATPYSWKHGNIYVPFSADLLPRSTFAVTGCERPPRMRSSFDVTGPARPDGVQVRTLSEPLLRSETSEDRCIIFFSYGIAVMWGLTPSEETAVLEQIVHRVGMRPLKEEFVEKERLLVRYRQSAVVGIVNDVIWLPVRLRSHISMRIAISFAFAQSTKLSVYEEQGLALLRSTSHLPHELAERGKFSLSTVELSKMIGQLFVHKSDLNMLSGVLDTPEYFWSKADTLQELYKLVASYLELDERIEAVKDRLTVVHELFDMLQSRQDAQHGSYLEWIVIFLVALEGFVGILEFCGTIGLINPTGQRMLGPKLVSLWTSALGYGAADHE